MAVTPGGNRGPPLWFTALLLRVLEAFECLSVDSVCSRLGQPDGRHVRTGRGRKQVPRSRPSLVLFSRALCARMCAIALALARPHPPRTHAPRPHTKTGPPVSATRPSLVLFSRALCVRMCAIAIALAQQHPPSSPPAALPSLPPSSWLTTSSSPAFTSVRWSDSVTRVTCQGNQDSLRLVPARAVACRA